MTSLVKTHRIGAVVRVVLLKFEKEASSSGEGFYARITNRTEDWQGLEQDITDRVELHKRYYLCAYVRVYESAEIVATLRLEDQNSTEYEEVGRISHSGLSWEKLEGQFSLDLDDMPSGVILYIEGPPGRIDLHVRSVVLASSNTESEESAIASETPITLNSEFEDGIKHWDGLGCNISFHEVGTFVSATDRKYIYDGIQQVITKRVKKMTPYELSASVRIRGNNVNSDNLKATLYVKKQNRREYYLTISEMEVTDKDWASLRGTFMIYELPKEAVIYIEGALAGTDIHINSFVVKRAKRIPLSPNPDIQNPSFKVNIVIEDIVRNDSTNGWHPHGQCRLGIESGAPPPNEQYIHVTDRTDSSMGPAQMITDKVKLYLTYQVSAMVKTKASMPQNVSMTLQVDSDQVLNLGQAEVSDANWHKVSGSFRIEKQPIELMFYIHGPAPGIDLMVAGVQICPVDPRARFPDLKKKADEVRKRDITLKFSKDHTGCLAGSVVKVRQTQNTFPFGSCINRRNIDSDVFVDFFVRNFNWAVLKNELRWCSTEAEQGLFDYRDADDLVNFCKKNNIQTRVHCNLWKVKDDVPLWASSMHEQDLPGLLTRYKGKFKHYVIDNEMLDPSLGEDIIADKFKRVNGVDPSATLFVNDYPVEDGCDVKSIPEIYKQRIQALQSIGAGIGGIGVQAHMKSPVGENVHSALDKLGMLGLPIWFTELDVSSTNEFVRADDLEIMLREAFAHPSVEGIMLWGFWELNMSRENSHLVNAEGDSNEAGKRYRALREEWLSRADGRLDQHLSFTFRGFQGKYTVEIVTKHKTVLFKTFDVEAGNSSIAIDL